jgi:hypothetical protein
MKFMPRFGEFETLGAPVEVTHERSHVATVWQARRAGSGEHHLFAIKVYSARQESAQTAAAEERATADRHRAFLDGVLQLKEVVTTGKNRRLTPIYDLGLSEAGAWYVTDFYPRGSLKAWISRRGGLDSATLKHVLHEVIAGCLALKQMRGSYHGNLKPANVFLTGKPHPLRRTRLVLGDPYPAAPRILARLDFTNRATTADLLQPVAEVQDLRALGELLLQLVESRLVRGSLDYHYPIAYSDSWQKLGKDAEYWRQMCNRLLDPELSLDTANLLALEQELRPNVLVARQPAILAGAVLICLLAVGGVLVAKRSPEGREAKSPTTVQIKSTGTATAELQIAQTEFDRGNYLAVLALCAKYPNDPRFTGLASRATAEQQELQQVVKRFTSGDYAFIEPLRLQPFSSKPPFTSLLKQAEDERQLLASLWALTNSVPELKRRLNEPKVAQIKKPPYEQIRKWAENQVILEATRTKELTAAQTLFAQGKYEQVLALCAKYPNETQFTGLAAGAKAEQEKLQRDQKSFAIGDYTFVETLRTQPYSSKPPFTTLITQADTERKLLAELRALTNSLPELKQRLSEPPVVSITKPPFQDLRTWVEQAAQDMEGAQEQLAQANYTRVLEICGKYPNMPSFAELAASANREQEALRAAHTSFDQGDYRFIGALGKEPFSAKPPFAKLLTEAINERTHLENLEALKQSGKWAQLQAEMERAAVAGIKKKPFEDLRWQVYRYQELLKELRKYQARLGTLPRGERPPLDVDGRPVVKLGPTRPVTIYRAPLRQLKQQFQQIGQLTTEREREFDQLEHAISHWYD